MGKASRFLRRSSNVKAYTGNYIRNLCNFCCWCKWMCVLVSQSYSIYILHGISDELNKFQKQAFVNMIINSYIQLTFKGISCTLYMFLLLVWCFCSIINRDYLLRAAKRWSAMEVAYRILIMYAVLRQMKIEKKHIAHDSEINAPDTSNVHIYIQVDCFTHRCNRHGQGDPKVRN